MVAMGEELDGEQTNKEITKRDARIGGWNDERWKDFELRLKGSSK